MKKIIKYLTLLLILIPMHVNADAAAPIEYSYNTTVIEDAAYYETHYENGSESLVQKGTLHEGKIITVNFERKINGEMYGIFTDSTNEASGYVKLSKLKKVDFNDINEYVWENNKTLYIFDKTVDLYEGPAYIFDKVTVDVVETEVLSTKSYTDFAMWYYVTINNQSGWLNIYDGVIGTEDTSSWPKDLVLIYDEDLFTGSVATSKNVIDKVPAYSKFDVLYRTGNDYHDVIIKYNDKYGKIDLAYLCITPTIEQLNESHITDYEIIGDKIYIISNGNTELSKPNSSESVTVPSGEKMELAYISYRYNGYYFRYNDALLETYLINPSDEKPTIVPEDKHEDIVPNKDAFKEPEIIAVKNSLTTTEVVTYSLIGTIILGLTVIVIIKLVNKKNEQ